MNNKICQIVLCENLDFSISEVTIYKNTDKTYQALDKFNIKLCIQKDKIFDNKNLKNFKIATYKYCYVYPDDLEKFIYFVLKRNKEAITLLRKKYKELKVANNV